MKACFPCVGLIVVAGCFLLVMVPDRTPPAAPPTFPAPQDAPPLVVLDPGHGGHDPGARGLYGLVEKEVALDLAHRVDGALRNAGLRTLMTRTSDRYVALEERVTIARAAGAHLFVSIHLNSKPGGGAHGFEIFRADSKQPAAGPWPFGGLFAPPPPLPDPESAQFAQTVHQRMAGSMLAGARRLRAGHLYVLRHTPCPAILIEAGFIDSTLDAALLRDNARRQNLALAIADGILDYVKLKQAGLSAPPLVQR